MIERVLSLQVLLLAYAAGASAQLISIRTLPVAQSHQFEIFPSRTLAMGGVSIAVTDSLLDPFVNPAKGAAIGATRFFGSPSVYSVSSEAGGGRTLPLGAMTRQGDWFGGLWFALQNVDRSEPLGGPIVGCIACLEQDIDVSPADRSEGNTYAFAMLGKALPGGLSVGGSVTWSRLNAVDGVDLLYAGSARIDQFGHALDVRLGASKEWVGGRSLEALLLHNRFGTSHDVLYLDNIWDPVTQQFAQRPRLEQNLDRTRVWGLHLAYEQPVSTMGWRLGWMATANRMDHPKIPNYEIMNIPRDPGHSSAFNLGMGVSRVVESSTFGLDVVYEPIWSHTWADAEAPIETSRGEIIPAGGMTIENHFRFSNALLRMGLSQDLSLSESFPAAGLQLGISVRNIHYWLEQHDHVQVTDRDHEESWVEWTPTWGFSLGFPTLEVRYRGSVTNGTGRPGIAQPIGWGVLEAVAGSNILAAPSGPLTLTEVRVVTHQISLSLPLH
jgi:hypothetical protein